ncbi:8263_t:CDS:1, partial [Cetraspora pellucida]
MSVQSSDSLQSQDISNTSLSTVDTSRPRKKKRHTAKSIVRRSYVHYFFKEGTIPKSVQYKVCIANSEEAHDYISHDSTTNLCNYLKEHEIYDYNYKNFLDTNNE